MIKRKNLALFVHLTGIESGEDAMKRDLLIISGGILAVGAVIWGFWGNPDSAPRTHSAGALNADPQLKLVSQKSTYMRDER